MLWCLVKHGNNFVFPCNRKKTKRLSAGRNCLPEPADLLPMYRSMKQRNRYKSKRTVVICKKMSSVMFPKVNIIIEQAC